MLRIRNTFKSDPNPVRTKNIYKKKILYFFLKILRTILQISCYECFMILIYMTFWCPRFCIHKNGRIQILQMYGSVSTTLIWRYKKVLKSSPRSFHDSIPVKYSLSIYPVGFTAAGGKTVAILELSQPFYGDCG